MKPWHIVLLVIVNLVWGVNFVAAKWAVTEFPPMLSNALRFSIVLILLSPFIRFVHGRMYHVLAAAVTLGFLHFGTMFIGMQLAKDISSMAIVSQLAVPFATMLAVFMLGERVGWKRAGGISLSFIGVMVIGFDPHVFDHIDAVLLMTLTAFWYALSTIFMRQVKDVPTMVTQSWVGAAGVFGSVLFSITFETGQVDALQSASYLAWGSVLYSGVMSSIVGHGGVNYLLRHYEVSTIAPYFLLTPLFAILAGVIVLDEALTSRIILGGAVTLAGVMVVTLRNAKKSSDLQQEIEENLGG